MDCENYYSRFDIEEEGNKINNILDDLLDCPFCGGKARLISDIRNNRVRCTECGASGGHAYYSKPEAIEMWNKRVV